MNYVYLYDISHHRYKNVVKKAEAWTVIVQQLNITSDAAKGDWKYLRHCYLRFKKSVQGKTGQARKYHNWPCSKYMKFLDDTLQMRPSASNVHTKEIDDSVSLGNEDQELDRGSEENGTQETPVSLDMSPPPPQKRKVSSTAKDTSHSNVDKVIPYLYNKTAKQIEISIQVTSDLFQRS
ncbi:hypothetical protein HHI36_009825 [Cryptolaemus montrouzieri]|uniref:MADF domain-containing protein n=1 Tax=Cryptolaemus montrouzieri TaxID=559131 RepID=A0ABD2MGX8_9CUCU